MFKIFSTTTNGKSGVCVLDYDCVLDPPSRMAQYLVLNVELTKFMSFSAKFSASVV
jgi:hypothetical protein